MLHSKRFPVVVFLALLLAAGAVLPAAAQGMGAPVSALAQPAATVTYVVLPGDSLARIAARFHTTVTAILDANPQVRNANRIYAGQRLLIPVTSAPGSERISFAPGTTSATREGSLAGGAVHRYVFRAGAGYSAELDLFANGGHALLVIYGADGNVLLSDHAGADFFRAPLPSSQDYFVEVHAAVGAPVSYTLQLIIPERIQFAPGAVSSSQVDTVPHFGTHNYMLRAMAGQLMTVDVHAVGQVILIVYGADGTVLQTDHSGSASFRGRLPATQDYFLDVRSIGPGAARYQLDVRITR